MNTKITLKNVKYAEFASEETHCYSASVYFDGKRVGQVKNDGHGGCDYQYPSDEKRWADMLKYIETLNDVKTDDDRGAALRKYAEFLKRMGDDSAWEFQQSNEDFLAAYGHDIHPTKANEDETFLEAALRFNNNDLEHYCCNLVNDWLIDRDLKKITRGKISYYTGTFKGSYNYYPTKDFTEEKIRAHIAAKHPGAIILNDLPKAELRELFG